MDKYRGILAAAPGTTATLLTTTPVVTLKPLQCDDNAKFDIILMFDGSDGFNANDFEDVSYSHL